MARPGLNARGKFFYVIGKDTYSAAQNLTNDIETYTNAIMLGEPTSENKNFYGDANEIVLPNSEMSLFLSFAWWQDKPQWENEEATSPHFVRQLTFEEYRTNKDPVLEMAIETDFSSMFIDPVEHLTNLFIAGEMEQLQTDLTRILPDPMYQHIAFDEEFVKQGEFLMSQEQFESAIFVFSMVTQAFPDNSTSWKRLGEAP